jgi:hypothetical protein
VVLSVKETPPAGKNVRKKLSARASKELT